jgi:hypothetical protein
MRQKLPKSPDWSSLDRLALPSEARTTSTNNKEVIARVALQADVEFLRRRRVHDSLAVLGMDMRVTISGGWLHFEMDLGNKRHREAFMRGEIANGLKLI